MTAPFRFAAIGLDHAHIYGQVKGLLEQGGELVGLWTGDPSSAVAQTVKQNYPDFRWVDDAEEIYGDPSIDIVVTAAVPADRAEITVKALRSGHHVVTDKPGATTFEQLQAIRDAVTESGKFWSVTFSERFEVPSVTKAGQLVREGRIGTVVQTLGLGPHREIDKVHLGTGATGRPEWFYDDSRFGGILCDIASHQIDQFLWFTGQSDGEIVHSAVGNFAHPDTPKMQDFGEIVLKAGDAQGYIRVDWFNPQGLPTWGDGRLVILGTKGYIELRKYVDIEGREGTDHLFVVDDNGTEYIHCEDVALDYYPNLVKALSEGMDAAEQEQMFTVMRLAITAQLNAERRGYAV
ncbi:Gfo/Idh/MocA family protein [Aestuariimicrobium soli]|uniref:Gfo/Idh/MocA family protein n=1 Tax=Aestuariimicrobium soli TaxID=2035834 RepID=UPI003EC071CF